MGTAKTYIPTYGSNVDKYWFTIKIAKSRALLVCEILDEEKIYYFLPTNDEILSKKETHQVVAVPMADLIFIHSSKDKIEQLKVSNKYCHSLCFTTEIPHNEIKVEMTELEKRQVNHIIIVDDQTMTKFLENTNKIRNKVTLLQYSETFSHIGKRIRINDGPLAGTEGVLRRVKGNKHIHLDLDNLLTAHIDYVPRHIYELLE